MIISKWHNSIREIKEKEWELLTSNDELPFYQWQWLVALEESGSISPRYGWQPLHLSLWEKNKPIAFALLYLKAHSFGEFIFDNSFVNLADHLGINYYPKLIGMSPLSPIEGYRFFFAPGESEEELTHLLITHIDNFAIKNNILSCHFLYVDESWGKIACKENCAEWLNKHSLWNANGNKNFEEYLSNFNSNQRKNIKKERESVRKQGINIEITKGSKITMNIMEMMHEFYSIHCSKWGPWGSKYLSESFFKSLCSEQQRNNLIIFSAFKNNSNNPIAMSLCIKNHNTLWGRYWGSKEEINCLHFELCYYSPISWALENGLKYFDPGAGGRHKRRRGFVGKTNTSLYRWYNKNIDNIIRSWLPKANKMLLEEIEAENNEMPIKIRTPPLTY